MTALFSPPVFLIASAGPSDHRVMIFFTQIMLLIVAGRLLGELMQRIGQPAVIGQLIAGIILGPSVFGALWPSAQHMIFPTASGDRQMLNAVSELGVLMLLLLTGMETDLALVKRVRRAAALTSIAGIVIPFLCGYAFGEMLPASLLPDPGRRLLTSLFLATALSISSVKIVAAVLREVDFLRRNLGQVILAAAILDDTIGWTILAFIGGLAAEGKIVMGPLLISVFGTVAFLVFCLTIGRRWVARIIRWTNDFFTIEVPVISVILVIMLLLAMVTNFIGVHTVLGAFVAGIMIGQSPILTQHIEEQLRGLIVALFMPVFFGVAGLSINLRVLGDPHLLGLALLFIAIASIGKLGGCYLGSRMGPHESPGGARGRIRDECARLDRSHPRHHRPLDGPAEPDPVHHHRRHGGGDDAHHAEGSKPAVAAQSAVPAVPPAADPRPDRSLAAAQAKLVKTAVNAPRPQMRPSLRDDAGEADVAVPVRGRNWTIQIGAYADKALALARNWQDLCRQGAGHSGKRLADRRAAAIQ